MQINKEQQYTAVTDSEHIKAYGQYFTRVEAARFMCRWACANAERILDPAAGNSIFLTEAKKIGPDSILVGYEADSEILEFFGNPADADLRNADYLLNDWELKFDAIVCNPPYNRFQSVPDRDKITRSIARHTGIKYSTYTNQYILFLIKSLYQLSENGRLAYIIPTEFLNSKYGTPIKEKLIEEHLLRAIINFENDEEMFVNATTTCCILLIDREDKHSACFYNLSSISDLEGLLIGADDRTDESLDMADGSLDGDDGSSDMTDGTLVGQSFVNMVEIPYEQLKPDEKWRAYLYQENSTTYKNLTDLSEFCRVSRGIATGANDYFCMSQSKMEMYGIPENAVMPCICRSADVKKAIFTKEDFDELARADKSVYVLNIGEETELNSGKRDLRKEKSALSLGSTKGDLSACPGEENNVRAEYSEEEQRRIDDYIEKGEIEGIHKKHLVSCRHPWYSMEQKPVAPIWVSSACRGGIKFVRNLAGVNSLTTFHSVYINEEYEKYTDIIFCYFLTPIAQSIIRDNRKEMGNGLDKFQPGDLNSAKMLDIRVISKDDLDRIGEIYSNMLLKEDDDYIEDLNDIFLTYLST
jgi:adenine-specific DNA-methyltransferase